MLEQIALGQVFLFEFLVLPVSVIPPIRHTQLHLHADFTKWAKSGNIVQKIIFILVLKMTIIIIIALVLALGSFIIAYDCT
jgi:uncharacterized membrane protein